MTNALRDENRVTVLMGVSSVDGETLIPIKIDPVTGRVQSETADGGGEANTASNQGLGVGVFDNKDGVDLEFRSLVAASSKVTITLDALNKEIDIDVDPSEIAISSLNDDVGLIGGNTGATDNAVLRANGVGGATLQNSGVIIDDTDNVTGIVNLTITGDLTIPESKNLKFGANNILADVAGTLTLSNIDALDATTESTIEAAIDTLANLTSIQGHTVTLTGDLIRVGAHSLTITTTGVTSVTFPTSGTLLANVVEDTSPQLGGALDVNGNNITSAAGGNITIKPDTTGVLSLNAEGGGISIATTANNGDIILSAHGSGQIDLTAGAFGINLTTTAGNGFIILSPHGTGKTRIGKPEIDFPTTPNITDCLDEDDMVSDSATALATQQSIKAYVDAQAGGAGTLQETFDNGQSIVIADTDNQTLTITNNDTTNNTIAVSLTNTTTGNALFINQDGNGIALNIDSEATSTASINVAAVATSGEVIKFVNAPGAASTTYTLDVQNNSNCTVLARFVGAGSGRALHISQTGVLGASQQAFYLSSSAIQTQSTAYLSYIHQANTNSTSPVTGIENDGTGRALYIKQDGILAANEHALYVYSNADQDNSALAHFHNDNAGSTNPTVLITNDATAGSGHGLQIEHTGGGTSAALYVDSNEAVALNLNAAIVSDMVLLTNTVNSASDARGISFNLTNAGAGTAYAFNFQGDEHDTNAHGGTAAGRIKILDGGSARYIYFYSD